MFASIDIETTGTDETYCQILEFACVLFDLKDFYKSFNRKIWWNKIHGEPVAIGMNAGLIASMPASFPGYNHPTWTTADLLGTDFKEFLSENIEPRKLTICGKNFGYFDCRFLRQLKNFPWSYFTRRFLDVGALYFDPTIDIAVPDTETCRKRCKLDTGYWSAHSALLDALLVADLVRYHYAKN